MRSFAKFANKAVRSELQALLNIDNGPHEYSASMRRLGVYLGNVVSTQEPKARHALLVCTAEDADFLAMGMLESLEMKVPDLKLACFWNFRTRPQVINTLNLDLDVAPIIRRYEEPSGEKLDLVIIVKSIISTGCVVRHAILDVVDRKRPGKILIVSPVIFRGADDDLISDFPLNVARRMDFIYFAKDDERSQDGTVIPGIGGSVYKRLGLPNGGKNFTPEIVTKRRLKSA